MPNEPRRNIPPSRAVLQAMKKLAAGVGRRNGFSSIEITVGDKTVVIDEAAAKRIRKNCDAALNEKKVHPHA